MNPRWKTLLAGGALILLANAVALVGVYLNRSGEAESRLQLTQRELGNPWGWRGSKENSGLTLKLQWRVADTSADNQFLSYYANSGGTPAWLDEKRMVEFGFDIAGADDSSGRRQYERQSEREVLVVLEFAGPAWEQVLARTRENHARHEAARQANPAAEFVQREKAAQDQLLSEETKSSRLFAIDAGLDLATLRAKYPDRSRYLILKGMLRPRLVTRDKKISAGAYLGRISGTVINVPHALRPTFEQVLQAPSRQSLKGDSLRSRGLSGEGAVPFNVTLRVGPRLEPWIEAVAP